MATEQETRSKYESLIITHFREDSRCPAEVRLINWEHRKNSDKGVKKWFFDIQVIRYLSSPGKIPEGGSYEATKVDRYIKAKTLSINPSAPNPLAHKKGYKGERKNYTKISKTAINGVCIKHGLDYRLVSIKKQGVNKKGVFWHPEHGYSKGPVSLSNWLISLADPFKELKFDREALNSVKLVLHDYSLSQIYAVSRDTIYRDQHNLRKVEIFCKLHQVHNKASIRTILDSGTFGCPDCRNKDFFGIRKIKQLLQNPELDLGMTLLYLIKLKYRGVTTLKFGITGIKFSADSDLEIVESRYSKPGEIVLKLIQCKRYETEIEARLLEQKLLVDTIELANTNIDKNFGGYTECRIHSPQNTKLLERLFVLAECDN